VRRALHPLGVLGVILVAGPVAGQYRGAHSADYLFGVEVRDARGLWVNPAGIAVVPEASIMGEVVLDRLIDDGLRLAQYTAGFSSGGIAFGFRHDRLSDTLSTNTFRLGGGRATNRFAVGLAVTYHTNADFDARREVDIGIRVSLARRLEFGAAVHHIGQPVVIDSTLTTALTAGVGWTPLTFLRLTGEVLTADRTVGAGVVNTWRGGVQLSFGGKVPIGAFGTFTLDDDFEPARASVGFSVGGTRRGILVASERLGDGNLRAETLSLTGVAINPLDRQQRLGQSTSRSGITRQR